MAGQVYFRLLDSRVTHEVTIDDRSGHSAIVLRYVIND